MENANTNQVLKRKLLTPSGMRWPSWDYLKLGSYWSWYVMNMTFKIMTAKLCITSLLSCSAALCFCQLQVLWDHDSFGVKGFLGSATLTLEDIHRVSSLDASQSYQLQGVKTGAVEIKVKVISGESKVSLDSYSLLTP